MPPAPLKRMRPYKCIKQMSQLAFWQGQRNEAQRRSTDKSFKHVVLQKNMSIILHLQPSPPRATRPSLVVVWLSDISVKLNKQCIIIIIIIMSYVILMLSDDGLIPIGCFIVRTDQSELSFFQSLDGLVL